MLEDIAQYIAVSTSEIVGYEVIITNENSIIIGSSDPSRLGNFHEASVQIIRTGKPNPDTTNITKMEGTKPGFALPIELLNKNIGSFGMAGEKTKVKKYCYLLKRYIETMLHQEMYMKTTHLREQSVKNLVQEISVFDPNKSDESYLLSRGHELGYDLRPPHIAVVIDLFRFADFTKQIYEKAGGQQFAELEIQFLKLDVLAIIQRIFCKPNDLIAPMQDDKFIILSTLPIQFSESGVINEIKEKCTGMIADFEAKGFSASFGIGAIAKNITELSQSYKDAWRALKIGKKLKASPGVFFIHNLFFEDLVSSIQKDLSKRYILSMLTSLQEQSDWEDLSKTICAWCESGFNQKSAANLLFIHRNTLQYRLNKIHEISGIDLKNYKNAFMLYLAVVMDNIGSSEL
ncbi:CdaR family transcriptional regulator [Cytobacillus pseudoceanisediminis]|uniref:CdaR family transcriptional regulator n=1 Tax=Cytobacillus pseudoceanisediminis TaxID=3051614 RepID=UPI003C2EFD57